MGIDIGQPAPPFDLPGTDGHSHKLATVRGERLTIVVFACNHCPYVIAYEPRLFAIHRDYVYKGLGMCFINPNNETTHPADSFTNMIIHAREAGHPFPYLRDESQAVAKAYQAARTPEVFVFDDNLILRYHGRVDDNTYEPEKATTRELRDAIEALLDGRAVPTPLTLPVGCTIKWK